ncbi:type II toxin-antitoxin system VapB family antitoxin [Streptomyces sp. JJ36]|uniref:type II toxin-antitoxin system VapB family antitoxin n=1 Tax=Streptomyces sp. JJ36 TaxID=2736645 RepID=UPI001F23BB45|nr:type II toxin-antitoxin system VapB family antitoxin [Streptomyces sp. JJ36]MCF6526333.1 type II toxin-antitoxin system VapB family antitoxin [Streptomyces sp. JJ36]
MARVSISLDAELAVEAMVLSGAGSPQDAVEAAVRDYIARGHRTEARTGRSEDARREMEHRPKDPHAD